MRVKSVLLSFVSIPLVAQVSPVAFSDSKDVVPAFDPTGAITLSAARLKVDLAYPRGKKERRELTVVYDSKTGRYLWHSTEADPNNPYDTGLRLKVMKAQRVVAFADPAGLIDFGFGDGLFAKAWRGRADSLDAAVSACTNEIRQGLAMSETRGFHTDYKLVPVFGEVLGLDAKVPPGYKPISSEFRCEPFNAFCPSYNNTIASISKQGSNYRLVLRNRFDVEVIVDQNLNLVSAKQLTQPKEPKAVDPLVK